MFQPESVSIKVISRLRPFTPEETKKGGKPGVTISGDKTTVHGGKVREPKLLRKIKSVYLALCPVEIIQSKLSPNVRN